MKAVLILSVAAVATAGYYRPYGYGTGALAGRLGGGVLGGGHLGGGGLVGGPAHGVGVVHGGVGYAKVDLSVGGSDYHFSWRHDGGKNYDGHSANYYCSSLGKGWQGVSIETPEEDKIISDIIYKDNVKYIWTSGYRSGYGFLWGSGAPFYGINWSYTGSEGLPQPDNAEGGKEFCLAVLNNFYNDGIRWHDVACHHEKPIICERRGVYYG
nr:uncharacterized protein LOC123762602 [Procambarus clarkii]